MIGVKRGIIGANAYNANAVVFDGSTYLARGTQLTGIADSKQGTISFFFRTTDNASNTHCVMNIGGAGQGITINLQDTKKYLNVVASNPAGTQLLSASAGNTGTGYADGNWHHFIISWDLSSSSLRHVYIDDAIPGGTTWPTYTNANIDYTRSETTIGRNGTTTDPFTGGLSDFLFSPTYIDLSVELNRRRFITPGGKPRKRSNSGAIWLTGTTASWPTNKGTGEGFTVNGGTLTTSANLPVIV